MLGSTSKLISYFTFQYPNQERLIRTVIARERFYFVYGSLQICLRELLWPVSHVLNGEIVSLQQLESVRSKSYDSSDLEVSINHISFVEVIFLSLHKFTAPNSWVFISVLVDLDSVVSTEEWNYEFSIVLVSIFRYHSGLVSKYVLIVCKQLSHIFFRRFRLKRIHAA